MTPVWLGHEVLCPLPFIMKNFIHRRWKTSTPNPRCSLPESQQQLTCCRVCTGYIWCTDYILFLPNYLEVSWRYRPGHFTRNTQHASPKEMESCITSTLLPQLIRLAVIPSYYLTSRPYSDFCTCPEKYCTGFFFLFKERASVVLFSVSHLDLSDCFLLSLYFQYTGNEV